MAQIDIGKLKPTWKSAYNNSTAYVVDDMVSYQNQSYICKLASTGNVPTNTTYWDLIAAKGSDGTDADLAAISGTVQGDLYYNNGSAIARLAPGTNGQVLQTGGASANPSWTTVSTEVVNTTMTAFQDAVNAGDRKRNPYVWTRYNTAVTVTNANNYFLWEVNGYVNHDNHPAGSVEVQEDSGSFVNAYNKSTLTGTAIVQANGQSTWGSNDHLSRYPHFRFDTAVNTNNNYAAPSSTAGIYKPTGTPTTLNFRVSFWSENSTSDLMIGANPTGGSSHGCAPLSYLKITEIKA